MEPHGLFTVQVKQDPKPEYHGKKHCIITSYIKSYEGKSRAICEHNKIGGPKLLVVAEIREGFPTELLLLAETEGLVMLLQSLSVPPISSSVI